MKNNITKLLIGIALMFTAGAAYSEPVEYTFSNTSGHGNPDPRLTGLTSVLGSFIYDNAAAPVGTVSGGTKFDGSTIYIALSNLSGNANGNSFSHSLGAATVGDNVFSSFSPPTDIFSLFWGFPPDVPVSGFSIEGLTLERVGIFWIAGQLGIGDFLSDQSLPTVLPPTMSGLLELDFFDADGVVQSAVFFVAICPVSATDSDCDGIEDAIDGTFNGVFNDQSTVFSNDFTDQHLGSIFSATFGSIIVRSDNIITVNDHPILGVILFATGGTGTTQVQMCNPFGFVRMNVFLTAGDQIVATCRSFTGEVLAGPVIVTVGMNIGVTIPAGAIVFMEELPGSILSISHLGEMGDPNIVIDDDGVVTNLGPDDPPYITILDSDADGVPDDQDNCPNVVNADQADADGDGIGDVCDVTPDIQTDLDDLIAFVLGLDAGDFIKANRQAVLLKKLDAVKDFSICEAIDKLTDDILPKTDGVSAPADWVTASTAQQQIADAINAIISDLQSLGACP